MKCAKVENIFQRYQLSKKYWLIFISIFLIILTFKLKDINNSQLYNSIYNKFISDDFFSKDNSECDELDPIYMMGARFKKPPIKICKTRESEHVCFKSSKYEIYNKYYRFPYGVVCIMKNITLDPLKSNQTNYIYKGPIDNNTRGSPIISKGFFSMNCKLNNNFKIFPNMYHNYFNSWNYNKEEMNNEELEELAAGKTILFLIRNQDSPNLFHGLSEVINALSIIYLFDLKPEEIQIIFLESMTFNEEPYYDFYKNIISRGSEPLYIKNLNKKYHITSAISVPLSVDSPLFLKIICPNCKYSVKTYKLLNHLINKYLNISDFNDSFISDNETFYYPKKVIQNYKLNIKFIKILTFQWRKVWPKGRKNQERLLGNGPELTNRIASILPNNYLVRLIDTASLNIIEQIAIMKKTDYFIGVHGAGLSLSVFMPKQSVLQEILPYKRNKLLLLMSKLSGHKTFADIIKNEIKFIDTNEYIYFNEDDFIKKVLKNMKEIDFIN